MAPHDTPSDIAVRSVDQLLLTGKDVAAVLRVSPSTVRRLVAAGHLQTVKVGRGVTRYSAAQVQAFVERQQSEALDRLPANVSRAAESRPMRN